MVAHFFGGALSYDQLIRKPVSTFRADLVRRVPLTRDAMSSELKLFVRLQDGKERNRPHHINPDEGRGTNACSEDLAHFETNDSEVSKNIVRPRGGSSALAREIAVSDKSR